MAQDIDLSGLDDVLTPKSAAGGNYDALISAAAKKYGVSEDLIHKVMHVESRGNPTAKSGAGAVGLMQLMPSTARLLGYQGDEKGLHDPATNIDLGAKLLGQLQTQHKGDVNKVLSAYNSGKGDNYKTNPEVAKYVTDVQGAPVASPLQAGNGVDFGGLDDVLTNQLNARKQTSKAAFEAARPQSTVGSRTREAAIGALEPFTASNVYGGLKNLVMTGGKLLTGDVQPAVDLVKGVGHAIVDPSKEVYEGARTGDFDAAAHGAGRFLSETVPAVVGLEAPIRGGAKVVGDVAGPYVSGAGTVLKGGKVVAKAAAKGAVGAGLTAATGSAVPATVLGMKAAEELANLKPILEEYGKGVKAAKVARDLRNSPIGDLEVAPKTAPASPHTPAPSEALKAEIAMRNGKLEMAPTPAAAAEAPPPSEALQSEIANRVNMQGGKLATEQSAAPSISEALAQSDALKEELAKRAAGPAPAATTKIEEALKNNSGKLELEERPAAQQKIDIPADEETPAEAQPVGRRVAAKKRAAEARAEEKPVDETPAPAQAEPVKTPQDISAELQKSLEEKAAKAPEAAPASPELDHVYDLIKKAKPDTTRAEFDEWASKNAEGISAELQKAATPAEPAKPLTVQAKAKVASVRRRAVAQYEAEQEAAALKDANTAYKAKIEDARKNVTVKKGKDFATDGTWEVNMPDGSVRKMFRDPETTNWYDAENKDFLTKADKTGDYKLLSVANKEDAIRKLIDQHLKK